MSDISIHKLGDKEYGLVTVPKDAHSFYLLTAANKDNVQGLFWKDKESPPWIVLPEGKWELVGKADSLSEDQWADIVEWFELAGSLGYRDYKYDDPRFPYETASISALSFLWKHRLTPETTVIIRKINVV